MITTKENVIVYTIQLDTEAVKALAHESDIPELFKKEFKREGLTKEAERMDKGGFSYRTTHPRRSTRSSSTSWPTMKNTRIG